MYLLFFFLIGGRNTLTYRQKIKAYMKRFSSDEERLKVKAFRKAVPYENVSISSLKHHRKTSADKR